MPLPAPNLDDRRFQDILDEARRLIPRYCPEWTDHNLSDPGITLLELFAWMTDLLLYRLNRVPDKNYIKFMDLLGIHLQPARPATTDITFRLSAPRPEDTLIPIGTSVGTLRTENQPSVNFATDRDLTIRVPQLSTVLASRGGERFVDYAPALTTSERGLGVFSDKPRADDGLYLGFANDLSGHTLAITLRCRVEGIGVDPTDPPLVWETWSGLDHRWVGAVLEQDGSGGLNRDGLVVLRLPYDAAQTTIDNRAALWLRARVLDPRPGQPAYSDSPRITGIEVESLAATVPATHSRAITGEVLGISDGSPGQTFNVQTLPVLPRREDETLEIESGDGTFEAWVEVPDFGSSERDDPHFVLDDATGVIELGPRIRSPLGVERQYGRVPPSGRHVRFSSYRSGGGILGNVGARTVSVLQSSYPYVADVTNYTPAIGGTDPEDIEHAKWRAPQVLRSRDRAVTPEDFELLARQASSGIARARCVAVRDGTNGPAEAVPGTVRVQLVPSMPHTDRPLGVEETEVAARIRDEVRSYLDDRRLLGSELILEGAAYTWVSAVVRVRARPRASRARISTRAAEAIYRYIHPTSGGPDYLGWPFGRELFAGEVYSILQAIEGVDFVEEVVLHQVEPATRQFGPPSSRIAPADAGLLCSYEHRVLVE
jgi:predicted phage baseplate assembly protein